MPERYEITVEDEFCAAHAIVMAGTREAVHGHNWKVSVTVSGPTLDSDGLLLDFHALERLVRETLAPFRNRDLNDTPPFDRLNPSAEHIARYIGQAVQNGLSRLDTSASVSYHNPNKSIRLDSVRVTEAPGCSVVYRPGPTP